VFVRLRDGVTHYELAGSPSAPLVVLAAATPAPTPNLTGVSCADVYLDLDNNGVVGGEGRSRGNDAWGYGLHPGQ